MKKYQRLLTLMAVLVSGIALIPYIGLSSEPFGWEQYADAYVPAVEVDIVDFDFVPEVLLVETDSTVRWTNRGSVNHTVTSDTPLFDSGTLAPGGVFTYTFGMTGTYDYHCDFHPDRMTGIISVADEFFHFYLPIVIHQ